MKPSRRNFLKKSTLGVAAFSGAASGFSSKKHQFSMEEKYAELDEAAAKPVLKTSLFSEPMIISSLELLRYKDNFICRVRTKDGHEGLSVGNNMQLISLYPIFVHRLQPFFIGRDARDLEALLDEVYVYQSNYKLQNRLSGFPWRPLSLLSSIC